jgi:transcription termination factor NusA
MAKFITSLPGVGGATAAILNKHGFRVVEDIANASPDALSAVPGFRASRAAKLIAAARATLAEEQAVKTTAVKKSPRTKPVVPAAEIKADIPEANPPKVKAPKPPKDEAPVVVAVKEKPAKVAKTVVDDLPKVKTPKAPKAEAVKPLEAEVKLADKPEKKAKDDKPKVKKSKAPGAVPVENKEKKVKSDKTEKTAGKGKKTK